MSEYILSVISLSCFCSFVIPFLKHGSKLKRYVAFSVSVVCVYSSLMPIFRIAKIIKDVPYSFTIEESKYDLVSNIDINKWILRQTDDELRRSLRSVAKEKFDIDVSEEKIYVTYDSTDLDNVKITKVTVDLSDALIIKNMRELQYYISDMMLCDCEVIST